MRLKIIAAVAFIAVGVRFGRLRALRLGPGFGPERPVPHRAGDPNDRGAAIGRQRQPGRRDHLRARLRLRPDGGDQQWQHELILRRERIRQAWVVNSVAVGVGDLVTKGQTLATADTAAAQAALDLAKANLAIAEANLAVDAAGPTPAERSAAYDSIRAAQQQLSAARRSQSQTASQSTLQLQQAQEDLKLAQDRLVADQAAGPSSTTIEADQSAIRSAQQQVDNLTLQIQGSDATVSDTQQQNSLKLSQATASLQAAQAKLFADLLADPAVPAETISADQAAVAAAQFQVDTINLQIQAANTQATLTSKQNALKLQQAQEALKLAQDKLAADQAAGPSSTTIAADQSAIRAAQRQVDSLTLSAKNSAANGTAQIASASQSLTAAKNAYALKVVGATAAQIDADRASVANAQESVRQAQSTPRRGDPHQPGRRPRRGRQRRPGNDRPIRIGPHPRVRADGRHGCLRRVGHPLHRGRPGGQRNGDGTEEGRGRQGHEHQPRRGRHRLVQRRHVPGARNARHRRPRHARGHVGQRGRDDGSGGERHRRALHRAQRQRRELRRPGRRCERAGTARVGPGRPRDQLDGRDPERPRGRRDGRHRQLDPAHGRRDHRRAASASRSAAAGGPP